MTNISFNDEKEPIRTEFISEINREGGERFFSEISTQKQEIYRKSSGSDKEIELRALYEGHQSLLESKVIGGKNMSTKEIYSGKKLSEDELEGIIEQTKKKSLKSKIKHTKSLSLINSSTERNKRKTKFSIEHLESKLKKRRTSRSNSVTEFGQESSGQNKTIRSYHSIKSHQRIKRKSKYLNRYKPKPLLSQRKLGPCLLFSSSSSLYKRLVSESIKLTEEKKRINSPSTITRRTEKRSTSKKLSTVKNEQLTMMKKEVSSERIVEPSSEVFARRNSKHRITIKKENVFVPKMPKIMTEDLKEIMEKRTNPYKKVISSDDFYEKGLRWQEESKVKLEENRKIILKEEMKICTFKPELSESTKKIASKSMAYFSNDMYETNMIWKQNVSVKKINAKVVSKLDFSRRF